MVGYHDWYPNIVGSVNEKQQVTMFYSQQMYEMHSVRGVN